jgi:CRP-like cAMP-binding protein
MGELTGVRTSLADGDVIFEQGESAADMYVVRSGEVLIVRDPQTQPMVLARIGPGDFFGEMALFSPGVRSATAVAHGATEVEVIDLPTFKAFVGDPVIWNMFARMSERVRRADELLGEEL